MCRTKIVATMGPACDTPEAVRDLLDAGVDVFRLNFSHGSHSSHAEYIARIRAAAEEREVPVAVLMDLQGPKIRTG
ncbi:MAG TPA: pyruvate kinase, partial [bacterium]|nr:pyruvate kinase [bacterium]